MAHTGRCSASTARQSRCQCSCHGALHGIVVGARTQSLVPRAPVRDRPVAPAPGTSTGGEAQATPAWREILDEIIEWWHQGHGQVTDPVDDIPEKDLVHGMSVKELIIGELHGDAVWRYGEGTRIAQTFDDGYDRVGCTVIAPDGSKHRGQARAVRQLHDGTMSYTEMLWES
jgi:hypothetical protein